MGNNLDLSDMDILTPDMISTLDNFKTSGASSIDFAQFYSVVKRLNNTLRNISIIIYIRYK